MRITLDSGEMRRGNSPPTKGEVGAESMSQKYASSQQKVEKEPLGHGILTGENPEISARMAASIAHTVSTSEVRTQYRRIARRLGVWDFSAVLVGDLRGGARGRVL